MQTKFSIQVNMFFKMVRNGSETDSEMARNSYDSLGLNFYPKLIFSNGKRVLSIFLNWAYIMQRFKNSEILTELFLMSPKKVLCHFKAVGP